jgi:hypothetical protein
MIPMVVDELYFTPTFDDTPDIFWYEGTLAETNGMLNQLQSGLFAPGIAPTFRYNSNNYEFTLI